MDTDVTATPPPGLCAGQLVENEGFVRRLARALTGDEARADDLVQETWLAALENPPPPARAGLRRWLVRVVRNRAALDLRRAERRTQRERACARPERTGGTAEIVERVDLHRRVVDAVLALPEPQREAVLLRYFSAQPVSAIAADLGVPEATVRSRLRRALARLRETLGEPGAGVWSSILALALAPQLFSSAAQHGADLAMKKTFVHLPLVAAGVLGAGVGIGGSALLRVPEAPSEPRASAVLAARPEVPAPGSPGVARTESDADSPRVPRGSVRAAGGNEESPEQRDGQGLQPEAPLAAQLLASSSRLDQVRAIHELVQAGTAEAVDLLFGAFLDSDDAILVSLLEEALLEVERDVAPRMMAAFETARDARELNRIAGLLTKLAGRDPSLERPLVELFVDALQARHPEDERLLAVRDALISIGVGAIEPVADFLSRPLSNAAGAETAAWVLSQAPSDDPRVAPEVFGDAFAQILVAGAEAGLSADERAALHDKTQWLAWAAVHRGEAEHDALAAVVAESLGHSVDAAQAQSLAWSLANMKGLSPEARQRTARSILESLHEPPSDAIRQSYVWAVLHLAAPGGEPIEGSFDGVWREAERAWQAGAQDPGVAAQLTWLRSELQAVQGGL